MFDNATGRPKCAINVLYGTMLQYITQRAERKPIVCCTERKKKKEVSDTNSATLTASQWFVYNLFLPGQNSTLSVSGAVHTTPEEFENRGFTLKTHQKFLVHTTPKKFENATITDHFGSYLRKTSSGKSRDYHDVIVFEKLCFKNVFHPHENGKPAFLNPPV